MAMANEASPFCPSMFSLLDDRPLNPVPAPGSRALQACLTLALEEEELCQGAVDELHSVPSPLEFYRSYVAANLPLVLRGAVAHWPAVGRWTVPYLRTRLGSSSVSVAVTPTGFADAPCQGYFALPEERTVPFTSFLDVMERPHSQHGVWYVQKQNGNLTDEFSALLEDLEPGGGHEVSWFSEALGLKPDAANFWMGDARAVTSMHKDHYENIYCVISGYKDFILIPATDSPWVPYKKYKVAVYRSRQQSPDRSAQEAQDTSTTSSTQRPHSEADRRMEGDGRIAGDNRSCRTIEDQPEHASTNESLAVGHCGCGYREEGDPPLTFSHDNKTTRNTQTKQCINNRVEVYRPSTPWCREFSLEPNSSCDVVPWVAIDPLSPDLTSYPGYSRARSMHVRLHAGDALYLPSLWFHHVKQSHACIAVNYWHDMDFGIKHSYYQMVKALTWREDNEQDLGAS